MCKHHWTASIQIYLFIFWKILIFYTSLLDISLHRIIISINFLLIYMIWWALTKIMGSSLYEWMNGGDVRFCLLHTHTHTHTHRQTQTHTHTHVCRLSKWVLEYINSISRTALRVTSWVFYHFIGVKLASHNCKSIHGNPSKIKVRFNLQYCYY